MSMGGDSFASKLAVTHPLFPSPYPVGSAKGSVSAMATDFGSFVDIPKPPSSSRPMKTNTFLFTFTTRTPPARPPPSCSSPDPRARVSEQPHPRTVLAPLARAPRQLHASEDAFGVRHDDHHAAARRGQRRDAPRRAVRILGVVLGRPTA